MSNEIDKPKKAQKRSNLGRGLGSLLGSDLTEKTGGFEEKKLTPTKPSSEPTVEQLSPIRMNESTQKEFMRLPIEKLVPNREQPRKKFSAEELKDLANSIKAKGLIQPIVARPIEKGMYQIIAGERRWRASQQAGLQKVPVLIKEANPQEVLELALIENIQRHDLNPIEEAEAYYLLAEKYNLTQKDIAEKVGKDRTSVANTMRILGLCREVREMVKENQIQLGHAKAILALEDAAQQKRLANRIVKEGLSVRATEKAVKSEQKNASGRSDDMAIELENDDTHQSLLRTLAGELQKELGTKVNIQFNGKSGKMEIAFYSISELNNIADKLQS